MSAAVVNLVGVRVYGTPERIREALEELSSSAIVNMQDVAIVVLDEPVTERQLVAELNRDRDADVRRET